MNKIYPSKAYFSIAIICTLLLSGCWFRPSPPTLEEQTEKAGQFLADGGYRAAHGYAVDSIREIWTHDGQSVEVSMLAPTDPGNYPLIIYLPGLGEHADGGRFWRDSWAKAGYTVLSVQPLDIATALDEIAKMPGRKGDDEIPEFMEDEIGDHEERNKLRAQRQARNSELRYLGHEYFSPPSLKKRMSHLFWVYAQLKQRVKAGQPLFAAADLSHVIVAGYDIGAQTAMAAIGEKFDVDLPRTEDFRPVAAIIFSPSVDVAVGNLTSRYKNINIPLLAVTGSADNDPYAISSPQVRSAVWEHAPQGGKYLLSLKYANHRLLGGTAVSKLYARRPQQDDDLRFGSAGGVSSGGGGGMFGDAVRYGEQLDDDQGFRYVAEICSVSGAFLDAVGKSNGFARTWLMEKADGWLDKTARLKIR